MTHSAADGRSVPCLNGGSSSLKFSFHQCQAGAERLIVRGAVERIGLDGGQPWVRGGPDHTAPELVDGQIMAKLGRLVLLCGEEDGG